MSFKEYKNALNEIINDYNIDIILLVAMIIFGLYAYVIAPVMFVETNDAVIDGHNINVVSRASGIVLESYIIKNQEVNKGDLLIEIDPRGYQIDLAKVQEKIRNKEAKLKEIESGVLPVKFEKIETVEKVDEKENKIDKEALVDKKIENSKEIKKEKLEDIEDVIPETKESIKKDIKELKIEEEELKLCLSSTKIHAPQHGVIKNITAEKDSIINTKDVICTMIPKQVWVLVRVSPEDIEKIQIGQEVKIKVSNYKHRTFKGTVTSVNKSEKENYSNSNDVVRILGKDGKYITQSRSAYPVKVEFVEDYTDFNLPPNKQVKAKIQVVELINKGI